MPVKVGVNGAGGRMGQRIVALTMKDPDLSLAAALEWSGSAVLGRDAGALAGAGHAGVPITSDLDQHVDVAEAQTPDRETVSTGGALQSAVLIG